MPVYHSGNKHKGKGFSDKKTRKRYAITCVACEKKTTVGFKPNPEKKQYCKPCYVRL